MALTAGIQISDCCFIGLRECKAVRGDIAVEGELGWGARELGDDLPPLSP